jgi:hypothetical protein
LEEVENLAGGHFAGSGQDVGVGMPSGRFEDAILDVDVPSVGLEVLPTFGRCFAGKAPGVVGVPDDGMGAAEKFEKFKEGRCGGEGIVGFDENFHLPAVFLFLFLPPVKDFDGLAVVFVCEWGAPSATTKNAKVRSGDLLGQLGEGEESGTTSFGVTDEFEGGAENACGVAGEGAVDSGEATGLF